MITELQKITNNIKEQEEKIIEKLVRTYKKCDDPCLWLKSYAKKNSDKFLKSYNEFYKIVSTGRKKYISSDAKEAIDELDVMVCLIQKYKIQEKLNYEELLFFDRRIELLQELKLTILRFESVENLG
jgi:hypothetical protein